MVAVSCRWCCGCSGAARRGCPFWCVPARWAGRIGRGPPRALWRGPGEGRWVTLGGVVLTVNGDRGVVERQLSGGELVCPSCGGVLGGWGHGVERGVRVLGGPAVRVCPRRSRCRSCGGTHVLLPVWCLLRRADAAAVIGAALVAAAAGGGFRVIARMLGRPGETVRGWRGLLQRPVSGGRCWVRCRCGRRRQRPAAGGCWRRAGRAGAATRADPLRAGRAARDGVPVTGSDRRRCPWWA